MRAALLLSWLGVAASFKPQTLQTLQRLQRPATGLTAVSQRRPVLAMSAAPEAATATATATAPTLTPERFVVQNRFKVKAGREAAFEKRWADRESRLGTLDGFRFFCMLRRVDDENKPKEDDTNYVSCTVWEDFANFEAWRKGDAFKEAHGGGTVGGVASMLMATAMNTKGKPKPAYWGGLMPLSVPGTPPSDGEGWRAVVADGESMLPKDVYVAMNRFSVVEGNHAAFEQRFANRKSILTDFDGFRGFMLLRRDGAKKAGDGGEPDDGFTHSTFSVWDNRACFEAWRDSEKPAPAAEKTAGEGGSPVGPPAGRPNIFSRPPDATFYEGILALESAKGV
mmetsp:Transcript_94338/g.270205  ORF Transcript_94338/g.270205 Transcript_94338/m.270205 type:complete len:339 (-) Transcript_94338:133-1149(-)